MVVITSNIMVGPSVISNYNLEVAIVHEVGFILGGTLIYAQFKYKLLFICINLIILIQCLGVVVAEFS